MIPNYTKTISFQNLQYTPCFIRFFEINAFFREKHPNATDENIYTTQEIKMLVGVDDTMKRVRYADND